MSLSSRDLVDAILLGPTSDRRLLQDSPILGDVWDAFAANPDKPIEVLITPYKDAPSGPVALLLAERLRALKTRTPNDPPNIAYLQGFVAARLYFHEVVRIIMPLTSWWRSTKVLERLGKIPPKTLETAIKRIIEWAATEDKVERAKLAERFDTLTALGRYVALTALILYAGRRTPRGRTMSGGIGKAISGIKSPSTIIESLLGLFDQIKRDKPEKEPLVWLVSLNRRAIPALVKSVPAVKGDAARALFKVKCEEICWAVLDSGIAGGHPAFNDEKGKSRVLKAFDFANIRQIVSLDNRGKKQSELLKLVRELRLGRAEQLTEKQVVAKLQELADDAHTGRPINWELVRQCIQMDPADPSTPPRGGHGTHVAGILGSSGDAAKKADTDTDCVDGMCPDIKLYDFRVLAKSLEDTEFAIIAALQFVRYLNERNSFITIHGANLSLSIRHDVHNFACGRTPICDECERLISSGVVVVAAAGNLGHHTFETTEGAYEGYAAFSITDPGNAVRVITVGATHRFWPHTYGVSFFSSRGPTGDGRLKPDLVAPGERIQSTLPNEEWGPLDGTSMAAPHVSGAAAMLMARYSELVSQPDRIKQILCESATDLGRERTFQGHGMLDVLRAFQRI